MADEKETQPGVNQGETKTTGADTVVDPKAKAKLEARVADAVKKINAGRKPANEDGEVFYDTEERVTVDISYPKDYKGKKHLKEGATYTVHPLVALNYVRNGFGELGEIKVGKAKADKSATK